MCAWLCIYAYRHYTLPSLSRPPQLLRSSLVNNRTQAKVAEELGMQEFAITNDKTKRPVALRTKTLADLLECTWAFSHPPLTLLLLPLPTLPSPFPHPPHPACLAG